MKTCTKCDQEKDDEFFSNGCYWCKVCFKQYRIDNRENIKNVRVNYLIDNQEVISEKKHIYYLDNRNDIIKKQTIYNLEHQDKIKEYQKEYQRAYKKYRKATDPVYKLRSIVSVAINVALKEFGSSKGGRSITKFLPYSIQEMKEHLEKQFEPWMTWNNWGMYDSYSWNDNDPTTWTWNIDHIVPHSNFIYTSMEDENFQKCWALTNLRPYSAKQNIIDGDRK